jgi:hypothetical protein
MSSSQPPVQTSFDNYLRQSWFHRNWKWFVPTLMVLGIACFVIGVLSLVQFSLRNSDACQMALQKARRSPSVVSAIGPTIKPGTFVGGSIHISGSRGWAELSIPISGERGEGKIFIKASKEVGHWEPKLLVFQNSLTGERTDLLQESLPSVKEQ